MSLSGTLETHAAEETRQVGVNIGRALVAGSVVALSGELGAGKTTLTQGIAAGLGIDVRVTSPTYTLVNEYEIDESSDAELLRLIHIDSYRLGEREDAAVSEAETFGIEEILDDNDAVIVIEWAERLASLLPPDHLRIELEHGNTNRRRITVTAAGPCSLAILQRSALFHSPPLTLPTPQS